MPRLFAIKKENRVAKHLRTRVRRITARQVIYANSVKLGTLSIARPSERQQIVFEIYRGPKEFSYKAVAIEATSACEDELVVAQTRCAHMCPDTCRHSPPRRRLRA